MRFNAADHSDRFAPLTGQHPFRIEKVEQTFTKAGDPTLVFELKILDADRTHWERFIVEHSNPKVVEISMGKLSSLSRAVGRPTWDDESELVGLVGEAAFGPQKDNAEYTEIKRYVVPDEQKGATTSNPAKHATRSQPSLPPTPPDHVYNDDGVPF